jgi:hypothetical protein
VNSFGGYAASYATDATSWCNGMIQFSQPELNRPIHEPFLILRDPVVE